MSDDDVIKPVDGSDVPNDLSTLHFTIHDGPQVVRYVIEPENDCFEPEDNRKSYLVFAFILALTFLLGLMSQYIWHII
jgi:hypothetical protein